MIKPNGKVTFLFTDIEGSTMLAQEFPDKLSDSLEKHNSILNNTVKSHNGFVFKVAGDAFCCAFSRAADALKAAVEIQLQLRNEKWDKAVIKIRIGIHTGKAEWNNGMYVGYITLARASRIMSVAYGEQIIISNDVYELYKKETNHSDPETELKENLSPVKDKIDAYSDIELKNKSEAFGSSLELSSISFRDLGERRLKDVIHPIHLFQVLANGLSEKFPPIKTLDARPNNLPVQLTSFIGREKVLREVKQLIKKTHLLTLMGTGGSGKTRLALQMGADLIDEFQNGVFISELASVSDPSLIHVKVMNSIGIKEESGKTPLESLLNFLKGKEMFLILDNCEHLINESAKLAEEILICCPEMRILSTSREALNCMGEQTYNVPAMSVPDNFLESDTEDLLKYESLLLFIERAISVNPEFKLNETNTTALAEICRRLDGIPLAIELAAASSKYLSIEDIRDRLDDRFSLLTGGKRTALPKHQTLRALIDWSYELLSEKERLLWKRLAVFKGGWDLNSAEEICSDEKIMRSEVLNLLGYLAEKSIVNYNGKKDRYSILETIKKYGEEKLKDDQEYEKLSDNHLKYYMSYAEKASKNLNGPEIFIWLDKMENDHQNFQSAIEWSAVAGEWEYGARLAVSLWRFWDIRGHYSTSEKFIFLILKHEDKIKKPLLGKLYLYAAQLSRFRLDPERSGHYYNESLKLNSESGDKLLIASSYNGLGNIEFDQKNYEKAGKYYEKALALRRESGDERSIAKSLNNLGNLAFRTLKYDEGKKYYKESLDLAIKSGDKRSVASSLHNLSNLMFEMGDFKKGSQYSRESLDLRKELGDKLGIAESLFNLGKAYFIQEKFEQAQEYFEDSLIAYRELGDTDDIALTLNRLADIETIKGNYIQAGILLNEARMLAEKINNKSILAESIYELCKISFKQKNYDECINLIKEYMNLRNYIEEKVSTAVILVIYAGIPGQSGFQPDAVKFLGAADTALRSLDVSLNSFELKLKEEISGMLLDQFSREEFDRCFEEGRNMDSEEAIKLKVKS